jgi:GT2 family glycosyltransferase
MRRLLVDEKRDVAIICNDDILVRPDTGALLAQALVENRSSFLLVSGYNVAELDDVGCRVGDVPEFACFAVSKSFLDVIGEFDENFAPAYYEDTDAWRRIRLAGYQAVSYAPYWHYGNTTRFGSDERRAAVDRNLKGNLVYYIEKWGGPPWSERFSSPFDGGRAGRRQKGNLRDRIIRLTPWRFIK